MLSASILDGPENSVGSVVGSAVILNATAVVPDHWRGPANRPKGGDANPIHGWDEEKRR
jgi:hypothetical protein